MGDSSLALNKPARPKSGGNARPFSAGKVRPKKSTSSPTASERSNDDNKSYGTYSSAMLEIKNNRKRAEGDLQLLENRILLLRVREAASALADTLGVCDCLYHPYCCVLSCIAGRGAESVEQSERDQSQG